MIRSNILPERKITRLAFYSALAISVYVLENLIPKPLPFLRLGLANVVILIVLVRYKFTQALIVNTGKVLLGGFIAGTIFSPTTLLAFTGGLSALAVMDLFILLRGRFSIIGISIAGACTHNMVQLLIVKLVIIKEKSIINLTPFMLILGIVTGLITGYLAHIIMKNNKEKADNEESDS